MKIDTRNIFLFDGLGAILSAIFTGLILPMFSEEIGLSQATLHGLAALPLIYSIYSLGIYRFIAQIKRWMLLVIISANLFYCVVSDPVMRA